jgi:hypothetical protein
MPQDISVRIPVPQRFRNKIARLQVPTLCVSPLLVRIPKLLPSSKKGSFENMITNNNVCDEHLRVSKYLDYDSLRLFL